MIQALAANGPDEPLDVRPFATEIAAPIALVCYPGPSPGRRNPCRKSDHGHAADNQAHCPMERPHEVAGPSTPQSDEPSRQNGECVAGRAPAPEIRTASGTGPWAR